MNEYKKIAAHCGWASEKSDTFMDDFLLPMVIKKEGLEKKLAHKLVRYKDVIRKMPPEWPEMILPQYAIHLLFKKDGLAEKYAQLSNVKNSSEDELEYLDIGMQTPWRFSFCRVKDHVEGVLFEMEDLILGETYLLFSPGLFDMLEKYEGIQSFLFLIGYNGVCWQTYSVLNYFKGFQPFDFFYFAKKINPNIDFLSDVQNVMEKDPLPFMMLYSCAEFPVTFCRKEPMVDCYSEFHVEEFEPENYEADFLIEKKHPVYMLSLKRWHGYPHFAKCYWHQKKKRFILMAMTQKGWKKLQETLNKSGYDFPLEPDVRATPAMLTATGRILKMKDDVDPYGKLFTKEPSPESQRELDKLNAFVHQFMDAINHNKEYDIEAMAKKAGIEKETANDVVKQLLKKFGDDAWRKL
ncbi:hypothetical protein ACFL5V_06210 [Fibrobacterota bacterium]